MRQYLETRFPDPPDWLFAFLQEKTINDLLVQKLLADVLCNSLSGVDDLPFDSYAGLLENVKIVILEESLGFLRRHVWRHLRNQVD